MESKSVLERTGEQGKTKTLEHEEKIEVEFAIIRRVYAREFPAIKQSFEEWADQWPQ